MKSMDARVELDRLIADNRDDYAGLSKLLGRNPAYIQQFIKRGTPRHLPERDRGILARYFGVDERMLGAPETLKGRAGGMRKVPMLAAAASAGYGSLSDADQLAGRVDFDEKWLRRLGADPSTLSLIRVTGDSMAPTLNDGDDIMVDASAATAPLRDGVHVIRMDDTLMVKRLAKGPAGRLSVLSDNAAYPDWPDVAVKDVTIIGRVIWIGRKL